MNYTLINLISEAGVCRKPTRADLLPRWVYNPAKVAYHSIGAVELVKNVENNGQNIGTQEVENTYILFLCRMNGLWNPWESVLAARYPVMAVRLAYDYFKTNLN